MSHSNQQSRRNTVNGKSSRPALILTVTLLVVGLGPGTAFAGPWADCHQACSPLTVDRIIPCECNVPEDEGGGTCVPDCDVNDDCDDCEAKEISGGILPRWELTGNISYLSYSDVAIADGASLDDGLGLNLGAELRFTERFGLRAGIAGEQAELRSEREQLREDVELFSVSLGAVVHLTPFQRSDFYLEPRLQYRFEEDTARGIEIPGELGYGARLGLALPLDREESLGNRWTVDIFAGYHVEDAYDQVSFGLGLRKEISPRN